jgi:hypothetical protein
MLYDGTGVAEVTAAVAESTLTGPGRAVFGSRADVTEKVIETP